MMKYFVTKIDGDYRLCAQNYLSFCYVLKNNMWIHFECTGNVVHDDIMSALLHSYVDSADYIEFMKSITNSYFINVQKFYNDYGKIWSKIKHMSANQSFFSAQFGSWFVYENVIKNDKYGLRELFENASKQENN